jgi:asparaginyl-tRNA synthetase
MRNNLAYATHQFFQERGFLYIHTPIITASDCEGAGEMFNVTTMLPEPHDPISKVDLLDGREKWRKEHEDKVSVAKKVLQEAKKASKKAKKANKKAEGAEEGKEVEKTEEEKFEYEKFLELKALEEEKEPEADAF